MKTSVRLSAIGKHRSQIIEFCKSVLESVGYTTTVTETPENHLLLDVEWDEVSKEDL